MNERIKELAEQTGFTQQDLAHGRDQMLAEFAELIVQECAEFIDSKLERGDEIYSCADGEDLKQHFGVEE